MNNQFVTFIYKSAKAARCAVRMGVRIPDRVARTDEPAAGNVVA
jgi:hypothetical protein